MQTRIAATIVVLGVLGILGGCSGQPTGEDASVGGELATVSNHEVSSLDPEIATGTVVETMDAAGYTYVRVDADGDEIWAAANRFEVEVGDRVTFPLETPMRDFRSESLDRDFPLIYFVSYVAPEGQAPNAVDASSFDLPAGHPPLDAFAVDPEKAAAAPVGVPDGGTRIVDIWNRRVELEGRTVEVSGRVVKYNAAILGRNWLHIQDGSGELAEGTNDLTVTTESAVAVGDIVTATGIVAVDRDFGAGYRYTVMLEDAIVTRN